MTPWTAVRQASLSFSISRSLLRLKSIELVMPSNHLILCRPLLPSVSPALGSFPVSWLFSSGGQSVRASVSASVLPIRIDWFDLLAVQGTPKSLLWHHSSKALIKHQFFGVQPLWSNSHVGMWLLEKHSFDYNLLPSTRYAENGLNFDSEGFPYKQTMNIKELQCERKCSTSLNSSSQYFKHSYKSGECTQF